MWQRIQTLFLFSSAIIATILWFVPLVEYKAVASGGHIMVYAYFEKYEDLSLVYYPLNMAFLLIMIIVPLVAIFLFKKLILQVKLCWAAILASIALVSLSAYKLHFQGASAYVEWHVKFSVVLFSLYIICIILAKNNILKDQKLLASVDRLR